ncbi:MAG: lysine--tRNA ligase [Chloroflexi bacterium]|nr:lysine--tRNA ligase [Chloroflexota bacterium]
MPGRGDEILQNRSQKLERLRQRGVDPYPARCRRSHTATEALALFQQAEEQQGKGARSAEVAVAGRITAMRLMGRAAFLDLRDGTGRIQAHLREDLLGEQFALVRDLDLGDFLEVHGPLFRTRTGEVTVETTRVTLLTKALRPPPAKWYGLRDVEQRYRQRYLDWIANEPARNVIVLRHRLLESIRRFLNGRGFIEVETPILLPVAAGAMARPFVTHHNALDRQLYLRIATELHMKRCIIGGLDKVYEIGRVFRNEGIDANHNPEFTLLESYEAYADYHRTMAMVEELVFTAAREVLGQPTVQWGDHTIDFTPPWQRLGLREALLQHSGIDIEVYRDAPSLAPQMAQRGIQADPRLSWGRLVDKLLTETVQANLVQPTLLLDYPVEMSPLAKRKPEDQRYAERFEGFAGGMEIANSFSELNDPVDQRQRFYQQEELRKTHGDEDFDRLDEDFLVAMEHGMPPTGGLGVGIDRLAMLLTGQRSIREVIAFPHLSPSQEEVTQAVISYAAYDAGTLRGRGKTRDTAYDELRRTLRSKLPPDIEKRIDDEQLVLHIKKVIDRLWTDG